MPVAASRWPAAGVPLPARRACHPHTAGSRALSTLLLRLLLQMWVWLAPNHIKAIWKVLVSENPIVKRLFNFEIGFAVSVPAS